MSGGSNEVADSCQQPDLPAKPASHNPELQTPPRTSHQHTTDSRKTGLTHLLWVLYFFLPRSIRDRETTSSTARANCPTSRQKPNPQRPVGSSPCDTPQPANLLLIKPPIPLPNPNHQHLVVLASQSQVILSSPLPIPKARQVVILGNSKKTRRRPVPLGTRPKDPEPAT